MRGTRILGLLMLTAGCDLIASKVDQAEVAGCYLHDGEPSFQIRGNRLYDAIDNALVAEFEIRENPSGTFLYFQPVIHLSEDARTFRRAAGEQWRLVPVRRTGGAIEILFPSGVLTSLTLEKADDELCRPGS